MCCVWLYFFLPAWTSLAAASVYCWIVLLLIVLLKRMCPIAKQYGVQQKDKVGFFMTKNL